MRTIDIERVLNNFPGAVVGSSMSDPTFAPTASPSYAPPSDGVVSAILCSTLFGVVAILALYFYIGYYSYTSDLAEKIRRAEGRVIEARDNKANDINSGMFPLKYTPGNTFED